MHLDDNKLHHGEGRWGGRGGDDGGDEEGDEGGDEDRY